VALMRYSPTRVPRYQRGRTPAARLARALRRLGAALLGASLGTCAEAPTAARPAREAAAPVRLGASVAGTPVATLAVTVSAADVAVPLVFNVVARDGVAQATLPVPRAPSAPSPSAPST
jgi:hypothetical protein